MEGCKEQGGVEGCEEQTERLHGWLVDTHASPVLHPHRTHPPTHPDPTTSHTALLRGHAPRPHARDPPTPQPCFEAMHPP